MDPLLITLVLILRESPFIVCILFIDIALVEEKTSTEKDLLVEFCFIYWKIDELNHDDRRPRLPLAESDRSAPVHSSPVEQLNLSHTYASNLDVSLPAARWMTELVDIVQRFCSLRRRFPLDRNPSNELSDEAMF